LPLHRCTKELSKVHDGKSMIDGLTATAPKGAVVNFFVYEKCARGRDEAGKLEPDAYLDAMANVHRIPDANLGFESYSYIMHMITRYDSLADVTLFTQDSLDGMPWGSCARKVAELYETDPDFGYLDWSGSWPGRSDGTARPPFGAPPLTPLPQVARSTAACHFAKHFWTWISEMFARMTGGFAEAVGV
jgi:hypothetical protein